MPPRTFVETVIAHMHDLGLVLVPTWGVIADYPRPGRQACGCPAGLACTQPGKHPMLPWRDQPRLPLADLLHWNSLHRQWNYGHEANWGLRNGASGIVTLDIDNHAGGPDGIASWKRLTARYGPLPATVADSRGHYYFRAPASVWTKTAWQLAPGVELLGGSAEADHLTYCPPSEHASGASYRFLDGRAPWEVELAPLPGWVESLRLDQELVEQQRQELADGGERMRRYRAARRAAGIGLSDPVKRARAWLAARPAPGKGSMHNSIVDASVAVVIGFDLSTAEAIPLLLEWSQQFTNADGEVVRAAKWAEQSEKPRGWLLDARPAPATPVRRLRLRTGAGGSEVQSRSDKPAGCACGKRDCGHMPPDPDAYVHPFPDDFSTSQLHDEEAAAAKRVRDEAYAQAAMQEAVRRAAPCLRPRDVITKSVNPRSGRTVLNIITPRCSCWNCPACAAMHKEQWLWNYRARLASVDGPVYAGVIEVDRQETVSKQINRQKGQYFYLHAGEGLRLIVSDRPFCGGEETTRQDAGDRLERLMLAYDGERKPGGSSRGWCLPKPLKGTSEHKTVGTVAGGVNDELLEAAVAEIGGEVRPVMVPASRRFTIRHWRSIELPAVWTRSQKSEFISVVLALGQPTIRRKPCGSGRAVSDLLDERNDTPADPTPVLAGAVYGEAWEGD